MARTYRKERLEELMWRELSSIISYELADPTLAQIDVTAVDLTPDLQVARVYIALTDSTLNEREVLRGLERASGFLRSQLAGRVQYRRVPELVFKFDHSRFEGERIDALLDAIATSESNRDDSTHSAP